MYQHTKDRNTLQNKPRNQIPIHQKSQTKPTALHQTLGMCRTMAHKLGNHPKKHRQHLATGNGGKLDNLQTNHKKRPTITTYSQQQAFYPSTVNLTDIIFTKEEQELLDLGAQYSNPSGSIGPTSSSKLKGL